MVAVRISGGKLATAIATVVVKVLRQYTGRGPTKSRTYLNNELYPSSGGARSRRLSARSSPMARATSC
jgi:hypothetical protein